MRVADFKVEDLALTRRMMETKRATKTTRWNMSKMWAVLTDQDQKRKWYVELGDMYGGSGS